MGSSTAILKAAAARNVVAESWTAEAVKAIVFDEEVMVYHRHHQMKKSNNNEEERVVIM